MIQDAILRCPIRTDHNMVEIAPGLYQCGYCGYGPSSYGNRQFYALHYLELTGDRVDGLVTRFDVNKGFYVLSSLSWRLNMSGVREGGDFHEELVGYAADPEELKGLPLPLVVLGKHKWALHENTPPLRKGMFESPYGVKTLLLSPEGDHPPRLLPLTSGR